MEDRADLLRRRIEVYRRYLREGVDVALAADYLRRVAEAQAELAEIEGAEKRRR